MAYIPYHEVLVGAGQSYGTFQLAYNSGIPNKGEDTYGTVVLRQVGNIVNEPGIQIFSTAYTGTIEDLYIIGDRSKTITWNPGVGVFDGVDGPSVCNLHVYNIKYDYGVPFVYMRSDASLVAGGNHYIEIVNCVLSCSYSRVIDAQISGFSDIYFKSTFVQFCNTLLYVADSGYNTGFHLEDVTVAKAQSVVLYNTTTENIRCNIIRCYFNSTYSGSFDSGFSNAVGLSDEMWGWWTGTLGNCSLSVDRYVEPTLSDFYSITLAPVSELTLLPREDSVLSTEASQVVGRDVPWASTDYDYYGRGDGIKKIVGAYNYEHIDSPQATLEYTDTGIIVTWEHLDKSYVWTYTNVFIEETSHIGHLTDADAFASVSNPLNSYYIPYTSLPAGKILYFSLKYSDTQAS